MSYLQQDRRKKKGNGAVLAVIGIILLLGLIYLFAGNHLTRGLHGIQRGVGYVFGYYDDSVRPIGQNAKLAALEIENAELKMLLGRVPEAGSSTLAVILSRPPHTPYDSLLIDVGEDHNVVPGDLVYGEMSYLIGHIEAVYPQTAVVKLFSSPGEKIDVLLGSTTVPVSAEGHGSGNFYIKVPRNVPVSEGDPIIVPGLHNIILGVAEKVDAGDGEAYAHIYFKLPVKLNALRYVQIKKVVR